MKLLNTFFVALFLLSTLVYLTGCDKTNTLVYTPVTRQYATNQFTMTGTNPVINNVTIVVADSNLTNEFTQTSTVYTHLHFLGHISGLSAARDTVITDLQFGSLGNTSFVLRNSTTGQFGTIMVKNTDTTFTTYRSIDSMATVTTSGYGVLAEYINGTFSGKFKSATDTLTVTNGQFSCYRRQ